MRFFFSSKMKMNTNIVTKQKQCPYGKKNEEITKKEINEDKDSCKK